VILLFKSLAIGISLFVIIGLFSVVKGDWTLIVPYALYVGGFFIIIAALLSGALASDDRLRANFSAETGEDRKRRLAWSTKLLLIGLPNIVGSLLIYYM
jgi:hypothetical protein